MDSLSGSQSVTRVTLPVARRLPAASRLRDPRVMSTVRRDSLSASSLKREAEWTRSSSPHLPQQTDLHQSVVCQTTDFLSQCLTSTGIGTPELIYLLILSLDHQLIFNPVRREEDGKGRKRSVRRRQPDEKRPTKRKRTSAKPEQVPKPREAQARKQQQSILKNQIDFFTFKSMVWLQPEHSHRTKATGPQPKHRICSSRPSLIRRKSSCFTFHFL